MGCYRTRARALKLSPPFRLRPQVAEVVDVKVINRIVNGRSAVTAEVALKLGATFKTTPEFWLNAQTAVDLFAARSKLRRLPKPLVPGRRPAA